jgi:hypothetical protein
VEEERRRLRRENADHHFGSLLMLALRPALSCWSRGMPQRAFCVSLRSLHPLKASWQKQVIAFNGYRELGMFDDAANALEQIEPEDKTRNEVLYARVISTWLPRNERVQKVELGAVRVRVSLFALGQSAHVNTVRSVTTRAIAKKAARILYHRRRRTVGLASGPPGRCLRGSKSPGLATLLRGASRVGSPLDRCGAALSGGTGKTVAPSPLVPA